MNKPIDVVEIFKSVNGEGDEMGRRTVFVRVFGCTAGCPGCDTPYAKDNRETAEKVRAFRPMIAQEMVNFCKPFNVKHITFTGGEPFEQPHMMDVIQYLLQQGFQITVETNGLRKPPATILPGLKVVVSPKPWMLVDRNRDTYFYWARAGATFKFAGGVKDIDRIRKWSKIFRLTRLYIQPWINPEEFNVKQLNEAYFEIMEEVHLKFHDGEDVRITPQFHKYLWGNKRGV
jgi:organic radical activating enzyme